MEREKRRLTAYKAKISDIVSGKYMSLGGFNPSYVLTNYGLRLSRVRILATVINSYLTEDKKYAFIVLDDGTGIIRSKAFQDTAPLSGVKVGEEVDFIGKVREYNDERYLVPELVVPVADPNIASLRKLEMLKFMKIWGQKRKLVLDNKKMPLDELKKEMEKHKIDAEQVESILEAEENVKEEGAGEETQDTKAARSLVLKVIAEFDKGEGVGYSEIIEKANLPENVTEAALNELLEEGSCYEPRPGVIRVL